MSREFDDALLHLRINEREVGILIFKCEGKSEHVLSYDAFLDTHKDDWAVREITLNLRRVLKRVDLTSRTLVSLIEPGSCFAGTLAELAFASDRTYMAVGEFEGDDGAIATLTLSEMNFGAYQMSNDLTRLETRFLGEPHMVGEAHKLVGQAMEGEAADKQGLVTFAYDDIDWDDEIRLFLEERGSFSPDSLTGMEANLRFGGPETMETKIFGRLTAWQNWIFQRPNAVGKDGALQLYGTGKKADYNMERV
jgi:benzoyl-CoA-dihydrodiol lyase